MGKKKVINTPESILLVSSFFMIIFISKYLVFIPEFKYIFEIGTLWFALPLITLILAIYSFLNRDM
ncbi:hypothetical protein HNO89_000557 [Sporosarcina luteola]|nr:hypothetical protein [Sporosarcina luteola]